MHNMSWVFVFKLLLVSIYSIYTDKVYGGGGGCCCCFWFKTRCTLLTMNMNKLYTKKLYKYFKIIFTKRMWKICERKRNNNSDKKGYTSTKQNTPRIWVANAVWLSRMLLLPPVRMMCRMVHTQICIRKM